LGPQEYLNEVIELHALHEVSMVEDKSITCVATFTLVKTDAPERLDPLAMIPSSEVQDYLGVSDASISAPYRLWANAIGQLPGPGAFELNTIGRAVEHIMGVSSVPVSQSPPPSCCKDSRSSSARILWSKFKEGPKLQGPGSKCLTIHHFWRHHSCSKSHRDMWSCRSRTGFWSCIDQEYCFLPSR
jgi:hypothetical protein